MGIFNDYTLQIVSVGSILLGMISGAIGSFAIIKKQGMLGDAVSHASLPGIAIIFLFFGTKDSLAFMIGATITGLLATLIIVVIEKYSRIKMDSAMALILSMFFGFGLVLLSYIQKIPNANQAGIDRFIFGQASTLLRRDIEIIAIVGIFLLVIIGLFWKELKVASFDPAFADSIGISSQKMSFLTSIMIVIAIIIGLQSVGAILISCMLVAPAVAARQWTNKLGIMVVLASIFGGISGFLGTLISSIVAKLPTGPMISIVMSIIVFGSLLFAPRGIIAKKIRDRKNKGELDEDRIILSLYTLWKNHNTAENCYEIGLINPYATKKSLQKQTEKTIEKLVAKGFAKKNGTCFGITESGIKHAQEMEAR